MTTCYDGAPCRRFDHPKDDAYWRARSIEGRLDRKACSERKWRD